MKPFQPAGDLALANQTNDRGDSGEAGSLMARLPFENYLRHSTQERIGNYFVGMPAGSSAGISLLSMAFRRLKTQPRKGVALKLVHELAEREIIVVNSMERKICVNVPPVG